MAGVLATVFGGVAGEVAKVAFSSQYSAFSPRNFWLKADIGLGMVTRETYRG